LAKPALILFLAFFLENKTHAMDDWRNTLLPAVSPTAVFLGLIVFQPDLGTAIACAGITACVLFVAGIRLRYFGYACAAALLPLYFLIFHVSYRRDRILAFLNPYADPKGFGFHIIQSLIAVATGGVTGLGLMEGKQNIFPSHTRILFSRSPPKSWDWSELSPLLSCSRFFCGAARAPHCARRTTSAVSWPSESPA
jgi:cell division protein FtsW